MRKWIERAVFGAVAIGWFPPLLKSLQWLFNIVGGIDLFVERIHDPGWVGAVINWCSDKLSYLLDLPPWSYPVLIAAGIAILWLDRRLMSRGAAAVTVHASATDDELQSGKSAVAIDVANVYGVVGDAICLSAICVTNIGQSSLTGCVAKVEGMRAIFIPDANSVVSKPMEGIPNPMVLRTEGQLRNGRKGPFNLRIGESKNLGILWRNKNGKGPRYLTGEDGTRYPVSNSFEVTIAVYGAGAPAKKKLSVRIGNSVETSFLPHVHGTIASPS